MNFMSSALGRKGISAMAMNQQAGHILCVSPLSLYMEQCNEGDDG